MTLPFDLLCRSQLLVEFSPNGSVLLGGGGRLSPLIKWPDRECLQKTMPFCFRHHYGLRVVSIIDCFELFIEKPSNLLAKSCTWSSYKHYNTAKYLISVTPQGSVSFISKGWGGRTSDKYITEHSGYLNYLLPGDVISS